MRLETNPGWGYYGETQVHGGHCVGAELPIWVASKWPEPETDEINKNDYYTKEIDRTVVWLYSAAFDTYTGPGWYESTALGFQPYFYDVNGHKTYVHATGITPGEVALKLREQIPDSRNIRYYQRSRETSFFYLDRVEYVTERAAMNAAKTVATDHVAKKVYYATNSHNYTAIDVQPRDVLSRGELHLMGQCHGINSVNFNGTAPNINVIDGLEFGEDKLGHGGGDVHHHTWDQDALNPAATQPAPSTHVHPHTFTPVPAAQNIINPVNRHPFKLQYVWPNLRAAFITMHICGKLRKIVGMRVGQGADVVATNGHVRLTDEVPPGPDGATVNLTTDGGAVDNTFEYFNGWSCSLDSGAVSLFNWPFLPSLSDYPEYDFPIKNGFIGHEHMLLGNLDLIGWNPTLAIASQNISAFYTVDEATAKIFYQGHSFEWHPRGTTPPASFYWPKKTTVFIVRANLDGSGATKITIPVNARYPGGELFGACVAAGRVYMSFGEHQRDGPSMYLTGAAAYTASMTTAGGDWKTHVHKDDTVELRSNVTGWEQWRSSMTCQPLINIQYSERLDMVIGTPGLGSGDPLYGFRPSDPRIYYRISHDWNHSWITHLYLNNASGGPKVDYRFSLGEGLV